MFTNLSFCSFCRSTAILLNTDLIQYEGQAGDRCQEGTQNLSHESILAGQFTEAIELICRQDRAFYDTALDGQVKLVLLSELAYDRLTGTDLVVVQALNDHQSRK